jgi:hypothetical protein
MIEIEKPKIEIVELEEDGSYGKFVVEPLERGFGTTLGNSLRRVLLSSLPGAAITSIKVEGVLHEFSTIPGVKEDLVEIILNLKELAIRMEQDEPKVITVNTQGPGVLTGADEIDIRIYNQGELQTVYTDDGEKNVITLTAPSIERSNVRFTFWFDKETEDGTVFDMEIILKRSLPGNRSSIVANTTLGRNFIMIEGSSKRDSRINLIR